MNRKRWLTTVGVTMALTGCFDIDDLATSESVDPEFSPPENFAPPPPPNLSPSPVKAKNRPPPISGGTLAVSDETHKVVAADPDRDNLYIVDSLSKAKTTLQLERGSEPGRVVFDAQGAAHVALRGVGALVRVDPAAGEITHQSSVCRHPRGIALRGASNEVIVACAGGDLVRLNADDHKVRSRDFIDVDLRDVVITADGRTMVSRYRSAELIEVDQAGREVRRETPATRIAHRFRFDEMTGEGLESRVTLQPRLAWRTTLSADGEAVMLHQRSQEEEVVPGPGGYGGGCESVTDTTASTMGGAYSPEAGAPFAMAVTAVDIAMSPDGQWIAVASAGSALNGFGTVPLAE